MTLLILLANILGWPLVHLTISYVSIRLPSDLFARDNWLTASRHWESDGRFYRKWLGVRRWKALLPDGAPWLGGFAKNRLSARNTGYLREFIRETRRAEIAHWCMLGCLPVFFIWNPPWACWVMTAYAIASNLPCIVAQRYNRLALYCIDRRRHNVLVHSYS